MSFFNKKEDVIDIQLTQYGKHLLSKGKFKPVSYAFFDEGILYDAKYANITEEQNEAQTRIEATPYLKTQHVYSSRDKSVKQLTAEVRGGSLSSGTAIPKDFQEPLAEKHYSLNSPLGTSALTNNKFPAWGVAFLKGEFTSYSAHHDPAEKATKIPQLNAKDVAYITEVREDRNNLSNDQINDSLEGDYVMYAAKSSDDSYVAVTEDYILLDVGEINVDFDNENFDIEVFEIEGTVVPTGMVQVPGGEFIYGDGETRTTEAFYIDIHEVTAGEYKECVDAGECSYGPSTNEFKYSDWHTYNNSKDNHPINYVSWQDAVDYCAWKGKRLPTVVEWEKAARGTDGRTYPWGNETATCDHAVMNLGGPSSYSDWGCATGSTGEVGQKPEGVSPYGVYDMAGNVREWTDSWFSPAQWVRLVRGGSFSDSVDNLRSSNLLTNLPTNRDHNTGFRCAFGDTLETLTPLSFTKEPTHIKDGILLDSPEGGVDKFGENNPAHTDPSYVGYWFDIYCDQEISDEILCANLPELEARGNIFIKEFLNCPKKIDTTKTLGVELTEEEEVC